jgi:hypothetical protein
MSGTMLPPVADEPASKRLWAAIGTGLALVVVIIALTTLSEPDPIPDELFQPVSNTSPTEADLDAFVKKQQHREAFYAAAMLARNGSIRAHQMLGAYYATGIDGLYRRNFCTAAEWLHKASKAGDPFSQLMLSTLYLGGEGVRQNPDAAKYWFNAGVNSAHRYHLDFTDYIASINMVDYDNFGANNVLDPDNVPPEPDEPRTYNDAPPLIIQSVPDIPVIGKLYGALFVNSVGCYSKSTAGFYEAFFTYRYELAERRRLNSRYK